MIYFWMLYFSFQLAIMHRKWEQLGAQSIAANITVDRVSVNCAPDAAVNRSNDIHRCALWAIIVLPVSHVNAPCCTLQRAYNEINKHYWCLSRKCHVEHCKSICICCRQSLIKSILLNVFESFRTIYACSFSRLVKQSERYRPLCSFFRSCHVNAEIKWQHSRGWLRTT